MQWSALSKGNSFKSDLSEIMLRASTRAEEMLIWVTLIQRTEICSPITQQCRGVDALIKQAISHCAVQGVLVLDLKRSWLALDRWVSIRGRISPVLKQWILGSGRVLGSYQNGSLTDKNFSCNLLFSAF